MLIRIRGGGGGLTIFPTFLASDNFFKDWQNKGLTSLIHFNKTKQSKLNSEQSIMQHKRSVTTFL